MGQEWGAKYADNWDDISEYVKDRDNYTCQSCGVRGRQYGPAELHSHHIHHKSEGGGDDPSNLVTLCWRCHNEAHDHFVQPMTEKARTDRPSVSTRSSGSSNTAKQTWKISDGPADENLQQIADDIYGSSHDTTTRQRSRSGSAVADNAGVTVDRSTDPTVTTTLQLSTLGQSDPLPAEDYTPHGLTFSILLILGIPCVVVFSLLSQSVISSALLTLALAAIAYPFLYIHNKPVSEDLNRINELIGPYEKKKREINTLIEQDGDVPDKDINGLKSLHGEVSNIVSRRSEGHFNSQFVDQVEVTTADIRRLERNDFTFRT